MRTAKKAGQTKVKEGHHDLSERKKYLCEEREHRSLTRKEKRR